MHLHKDDYEELSTNDRYYSSQEFSITTLPEPRSHALFERNSINERVKKIRQKYGMGLSRLTENDIENSSIQANLPERKGSLKKETNKLIKTKQTISQLESINQKIHEIISDMKAAQGNQLSNYQKTLSYLRNEPTRTVERGLKTSISRDKRNCGSLTNFRRGESCHLRPRNSKTKGRESAPHYFNTSNLSSQSSKRKAGQIKKANQTVSDWRDKIDTPSARLYLKNLREQDQNRFTKRLCRQVKYDKQAMEIKTVFRKQSEQCQNKIISILARTLDKKEINKLTKVEFEQMDPEYTERKMTASSSESPERIARKLIQCDLVARKHWEDKLQHKFFSEGINLAELDMEGKGYVVKQDLARFVSISSKKMHCNRAVTLIFKRIGKGKNRVSIAELTACFCS